VRPIRIVNSTRGSGEGRSGAAMLAYQQKIDLKEQIVTLTRQRDALAEALHMFTDHFSDGEAGMEEAMCEKLDAELFAARVALAEVEGKP